MDDDDIGREQARLVRLAIVRAHLELEDVWLHFFSLGGDVGAMEVEAYLHHAFVLPRLQRDLLAHAVNELIDHRPSMKAPYATDISQGETSASNQAEDDDAQES
jgi:hypothetical protein